MNYRIFSLQLLLLLSVFASTVNHTVHGVIECDTNILIAVSVDCNSRHCGSGSEKGFDPMAYFVVKALEDGFDHMFVNKELWIHSVPLQREGCYQFDLYDTGTGLLYLQHKKARSIGIKTGLFRLIKNPYNQQELGALTLDTNWSVQLVSFIDLQVWNRVHATQETVSLIHLAMHGMKPFDFGPACGPDTLKNAIGSVCRYGAKFITNEGYQKAKAFEVMTNEDFANLLDFFAMKLKITMLSIGSCYWTAQRVQQLMDTVHGYKTLPFSVLTATNIEQKVYFDLDPDQKGFFNCCKEWLRLYKEMKKVAAQTDFLRISENKAIKMSFLLAGTDKAVTV